MRWLVGARNQGEAAFLREVPTAHWPGLTPLMTGWRMPNARVPSFRNARRLRLRSCLRFSHFILFLRSITRPLAREEERLAHIAELASGRSEAEEGAQEREKNGTSGVHGGGYFAPRGTRTTFFGFWVLFLGGFIYVRSTRAPTDGPSLTSWAVR
jgi:hypothetical protein